MGAPPLLHTLSSGKDRLLKKHTAPCALSSFEWGRILRIQLKLNTALLSTVRPSVRVSQA